MVMALAVSGVPFLNANWGWGGPHSIPTPLSSRNLFLIIFINSHKNKRTKREKKEIDDDDDDFVN